MIKFSITFLSLLVSICACQSAKKPEVKTTIVKPQEPQKPLPTRSQEHFSEWSMRTYVGVLEANQQVHYQIDSLLLHSPQYRAQVIALDTNPQPSIRFFGELFKSELEARKTDDSTYYLFSSLGYDFGVGWYHRTIFGGSYQIFNAPDKNSSEYFKFLIHRYIVGKTKRSPERIQQLFDRHKQFLYQIMPKQTYKNAQLHYLVNSLIGQYKFFQSNGYKAFFQKLEQHPFQSPYQKNLTYNQHYYPPSAREKNGKPSLKIPAGKPGDRYPIHFWHRRYQEGNMEVVYKILQEIAAHYQE